MLGYLAGPVRSQGLFISRKTGVSVREGVRTEAEVGVV